MFTKTIKAVLSPVTAGAAVLDAGAIAARTKALSFLHKEMHKIQDKPIPEQMIPEAEWCLNGGKIKFSKE